MPGPSKRESDLALAGPLAFDDVPVVGVVHRTVLLERIEREDDVVRGHGLAVVPARRGIQSIDDVGEIVGIGGGFRQQPIGGRRLILRPRRQRLNDQRGAAAIDPFNPSITMLKLSKVPSSNMRHDAALRRIRIDVVEPLEAGGIFDVAVGRHARAASQPIGRGLRMGRFDRGRTCG